MGVVQSVSTGFKPAQPQQLAVATYKYLIVDIETAEGSPDDVEHFVQHTWRPAADWKDETIGKRYRETLVKAKEKSALLDCAPIISIAVKSDSELRCFHAMKAHRPALRMKAMVQGFATLKPALEAFGALLAARVGPETVIAGHNIKGFDLRRLRSTFVRQGLPVPLALLNRDQQVLDLMDRYCYEFSVSREKMASLHDILEDLGIKSHKKLVNGGEIPQLYANGEFESIVDYNLLDVLAEEDLFLRMTGGR